MIIVSGGCGLRNRRWSLALLAGLLILTGVKPVWAALGSHAMGTAEGDCAVCHNTSPTEKTRGWAMPITTLTGGWYDQTIAKLCYNCHDSSGGPTTFGNDMSNLAYNPSNHYKTPGYVYPPNDYTGTTAEDYTATNLPYTTGADIDCTTCHNVHNNAFTPFSMKGTAGGDFSELCRTCHLDRQNDNGATVGGVGGANSIGGAYSTHPTDVTLSDIGGNGITTFASIVDPKLLTTIPTVPPSGNDYVLGGKLTNPLVSTIATTAFSCQTCHQVHGSAAENATDELLTIQTIGVHATGAVVTVCTGCHGNPTDPTNKTIGGLGGVATWDLADHPVDGNNSRTFYPDFTTVGIDGLPTAWESANRPNYGATSINTAGGGTPACSSCHDAHGGVDSTSLLYAPDSGVEGGWCFNCHRAAEVIPDYHHSCTGNDDDGSTFTSQLGCGDCHGAKGGTATNDGIWAAHNGFWAFRKGTAVSDSDSLLCAGTDDTSGCHKDIAPTTFWDGAKSGLSTYDLTSFPTSHGVDRGDASHYIGPDSGEFAGVAPNTGPWPALDGGLPSIQYYSEYGGQTGGGNIPPSGAGDIICESCHNILYNAGSLTTPASTLYGGWQANLLLEPYEDDTAGTAQGETPDYFSGSTGDALCTECHTGSGTHHPIGTGLDMTKADQTVPAAAPNGLSFPAFGSMDCDSCHRPHDADDDSVTAGGTHGHTIDLTRATYHILELDGVDHDWSVLCDDCHAK